MTDVRVVTTDAELEDTFAVRRAVFVDEQGVDEALEYDDHEDDATHFVAYDGEQPVGAARVRSPEPGVGKAERVAVLGSHRGLGIGRELMHTLEAEAESMGVETIVLHSQTQAAEFYERLGYERVSDVFEEASIPHVRMEKSLE